MFRLELRFQSLTIREYILEQEDIRIIGRDPEAHIIIDEPDVSRKHACIGHLGNELFVWDEGSKHGTVVNGVQIICAKLKHDDVISIGVNHNLKASVVTESRSGTISGVYDYQRNLMTTI